MFVGHGEGVAVARRATWDTHDTEAVHIADAVGVVVGIGAEAVGHDERGLVSNWKFVVMTVVPVDAGMNRLASAGQVVHGRRRQLWAVASGEPGDHCIVDPQCVRNHSGCRNDDRNHCHVVCASTAKRLHWLGDVGAQYVRELHVDGQTGRPGHQRHLDAVLGCQQRHHRHAERRFHRKADDGRVLQQLVEFFQPVGADAHAGVVDANGVPIWCAAAADSNGGIRWAELGGVVEQFGEEVSDVGHDVAAHLHAV